MAIEVLSHPLVVAVAGVILGFGLGRWAARSDQRARIREQKAAVDLARIQQTVGFYIRLLDWEMRRLNWTAAQPRLGPRPRFADEPDANLALLGDERLLADFDSLLSDLSLRENTPAGVLQSDKETHVALVQRILTAAERQTLLLLEGKAATQLSSELIAQRPSKDRSEELRVDQRRRRFG